MEGATKNSGYIHGLTSVVMVRPRSSAGAGAGVAVARGHLFLVLALAEDPASAATADPAARFSSVSSLASPCSINGVAWWYSSE